MIVTGARRGPVCTFGDAVVDVVVELSAPLAPDDDVPGRTTLLAGGQAANVAAWVVAMGGAASVLTRLGDDAAGLFVRDAMAARGVEVRAPDRHGRTGTVVSIVDPDGTRTMASDRADALDLHAGDLRAEWFAECAWLHLSGYALLGSPDPEAPLHAATLARAARAQVSVDLSAATLVRHCGADEVRRRVAAAGATLVFANRAEAEALGALAVDVLVVKQGPAGASIVTAAGARTVAARTVGAVRDTTGAGDAFAAGWLVGGPDVAADAAARCVASLGAMPT